MKDDKPNFCWRSGMHGIKKSTSALEMMPIVNKEINNNMKLLQYFMNFMPSLFPHFVDII